MESISKDDLESLQYMMAQAEQAQHALQVFQNHIAQKYLKPGDKLKINGEIERAPQRPVAVPADEAATG